MSKNTIKKIIVKSNYTDGFIFIIAFFIMGIYLFQLPDMISCSGDSSSIWNSIKTFNTQNKESSYVMYKGFLSIYPYVWFYRCAEFLSLNEFVFVKIYHCFLFSYITVLGFPNLSSNLLNVKITKLKKLLFVVIVFFMWEYTNVFSQIMVDLPSLAIFLLLVNSAIKISSNKIYTSNMKLFYFGVLAGLGFCFSGQYSLPTQIIVMYFFISVIRDLKIEYRNKAKYIKKFLLIATIVFIGMGIPIGYNNYFEDTVLRDFRERGDWLPNASVWVKYGLTRDINNYGKLNSNRGEAIIIEHEGDNYKTMKLHIAAGSYQYEYSEYINLIINRPLDFIVGWCNRLFLSLSFDGGNRSFFNLFISFLSVFISCLVLKKNCNIINDLFNKKSLIILSFVAIILPLCLLHVENRFSIGMNGFLISIGIFSNMHKDDIIEKEPFKERKVKYIYIIFFVYIVFCYMHFATIYEALGPEPNRILFNW